jgi:uncharacterized membrane protein
MSFSLPEKCFFNAYELSEIWHHYLTSQGGWVETYTFLIHYIYAYSMHSAYNQENIEAHENVGHIQENQGNW